MKVEGSIALVTGANRGLGLAFVEALLAAGAKTVYAAARNPSKIVLPVARPIRLDITSAGDVAAAADLPLLVNNAAVLQATPFLADSAEAGIRASLETNFYGTLVMSRAFAAVLKANGGGALVNMLSVLSWLNRRPAPTALRNRPPGP